MQYAFDMKITIPEEYRGHFQDNIAYLTWRARPTLLLMNREESKSFQEWMEQGAWVRYEGGDCEHATFSQPIVELAIENGTIDIPTPQDPTRQLQGENRAFRKEKAGIILS